MISTSVTEELVYETEYWKVLLGTDQRCLGYCVIVLKRPCGDLAEVTETEFIDFLQYVVIKLESGIKKAFNATMFNWSCLMNHAYQESPPKP